jgi:hypothetical protein
MNAIKTAKLLIGTSSLFLSLQSYSGTTELPSIGATEVYITNTSSSTTVNFTVGGNKCSPPLSVSLRPDFYGTYTCNGASSFNFSIATRLAGGSTVTRSASLAPTRRYEIYSESSGIWNIREVTPR